MFKCAVACVACAVLVLGQESREVGNSGWVMTDWDSWSSKTIEKWRVEKVLHGHDLDKAKRTCAAIAVAWKRCARAEKVEELLDAAWRAQFDRLIDAILAGSKKWKKAELQEMKKTIQAKLASVNIAKNLFAQIGRDFETLHILMNSRLLDAKTLPADKSKILSEHVAQVKVEQESFQAADLWDEGVEERGQKAIGLIEAWLKDL